MSHDEIATSMFGAASPLKASKRAAQHILSHARKVPLSRLLDSLEHGVSRIMSSPERVMPKARSQMLPEPPSGSLAPRRAKHQVKNFHSTRKHVIELYEAFVTRQEVEQARARASEKEKEATAATARSVVQPGAGSFVDVLKLYYPHFSRATLEMMVSDAKEGIELVDRRSFIAHAKGTYAERLRLAFVKADKDASGGLSLDEFIQTVKATGAQPPGRSASYPASDAELRSIFDAADGDGNGVLELDEFLEMCAHETWLVKAFDRIVELGVRRKLKAEEARLTTIFRHPVSPLSRCVRTPNGRKYRPGLFDLRSMHEIGETLARERGK